MTSLRDKTAERDAYISLHGQRAARKYLERKQRDAKNATRHAVQSAIDVAMAALVTMIAMIIIGSILATIF